MNSFELNKKFRRLFLGDEIRESRTVEYFGIYVNEFQGDKNLFDNISPDQSGVKINALSFRLNTDYCLENSIFEIYTVSESCLSIYTKYIEAGIGYGGNWTGGLATKKRFVIQASFDTIIPGGTGKLLIKFSIIDSPYYNSRKTSPFPRYDPFTGDFNFDINSGSQTKAVR